MKKVADLISAAIKTCGIESAVRLDRIKKVWPDILNKPASLHAYPSVMKNGELLVNVDSPMWLQQLSFYKEDIAKKLQQFGVTAVRLKLGKVPTEKKQEKAISNIRPLTAGDASYIEDTVSSISDQDLKSRITKAIEKSIVFKR